MPGEKASAKIQKQGCVARQGSEMREGGWGASWNLQALRCLLNERQIRAWLPLVLMYVRDRGGLNLLLTARYLAPGT